MMLFPHLYEIGTAKRFGCKSALRVVLRFIDRKVEITRPLQSFFTQAAHVLFREPI